MPASGSLIRPVISTTSSFSSGQLSSSLQPARTRGAKSDRMRRRLVIVGLAGAALLLLRLRAVVLQPRAFGPERGAGSPAAFGHHQRLGNQGGQARARIIEVLRLVPGGLA